MRVDVDEAGSQGQSVARNPFARLALVQFTEEHDALTDDANVSFERSAAAAIVK